MGNLTRRLFTEQSDLLANMEVIIVPHDPDEVTEDQALLARFSKQIVFTGPIVRKSLFEIQPDRTVTKYGLSDSNFNIVVTAGGGGWVQTRRFLHTVIAALSDLASNTSHEPIRTIIVTGPHYADTISHDIPRHWQVIDFEPEMMDLMAAVSLVICQAGYNTLNEIAEIGVPAVCIPVIEASDQINRARYFANRFPNIVESDLVVSDIVSHILAYRSRSPFRFSSADQSSMRVAQAREAVINLLLKLIGETGEA